LSAATDRQIIGAWQARRGAEASMDPLDAMLLGTAAKNFEDIGKMGNSVVMGGDGLRRMALGLAQFTRATKNSIGDQLKAALAETAAKNFDAIGKMGNDEATQGDGLRRMALGLMQLSRAMTGL